MVVNIMIYHIFIVFVFTLGSFYFMPYPFLSLQKNYYFRFAILLVLKYTTCKYKSFSFFKFSKLDLVFW